MKNYSESCEENKRPILDVIKDTFAATRTVLEIGSGTGQHAVYFAQHLPHVHWQPSDLGENHASINAWRNAAGLANLAAPLMLDVTGTAWPEQKYDGLFSANTTHIMSWPAVQQMFAGIGALLEQDARCCLYGPFNYAGRFTSDSNARFDAWLKGRDPASGIRHFEDLDELAAMNDMALVADHEMPVNNRLLVWRKE